MSRAKKTEIIENKELCEGVVLSRSFFEKKENRLFTLLIKGFIVYLLSMGSLGFYLSCFDIGFNVPLCHAVIGVMAILCALLYYRLLVENLGYLLLLAIFGSLVFLFRRYINSGFYAIVNITVEEAARYLNTDIQRLYNEQIANRYLTVTMVALFIGIVLDILLNVYISRRMQYMTAIFIVMSLNLIPLYLVCEPDILYVIMMLGGIAMAYCFRSGRHYSPQVSVKRNNNVYAERGRNGREKRKGRRKKNREIAYVYDIRAMMQAGCIAVCVVMAFVVVISTVKPKKSFNVGYQGNKYKDLTVAAMTTLLIDGWSGFYRTGNDVGGMNGGKLGDVSTVRLDHETDLEVQFAPYSYDTVYLKTFTGETYNPYENTWTSLDDLKWYDSEQTPEADCLRSGFESGQDYTARGIMRIRNVGVGNGQDYLPYYYQSYSNEGQGYRNIVYYPRLEENAAYVQVSAYTDGIPYTDADLYVPEENLKVIQELTEDIGFDGSTEHMVQQLAEYYQDNIPYTIRPGKTPKKKDFINYFLADNRKGYCAHYASAATLVFRYLGIPARYVEGYSIDYNQVTDGELVEDALYEDYYEGYSALGKTALVQVDVTDADAHAWVEIYTNGAGWHVVDVTPVGEVEDVEDFWDMFDDILGDSDETTDTDEITQTGGITISDELIRKICYGILGIIGLFGFILLIIRGKTLVVYAVRYRRAGTSDRLILWYGRFRRQLARRDRQFASKVNYREQIEYLSDKRQTEDSRKQDVHEIESVIDILERAGFSGEEITPGEYERVTEWLKRPNSQG